MATTINADTVSGGAIVTGDNSGILELQTGGTTAITIGTDQSVTFAGTVVGTSGTYSATASGSLANGDKVIVNSDGTVSVVSGSANYAFNSASTTYTATTYDSTNQKVVIAYNEGSTGKAIVGTVTGTSISFGTAVTFHATNATYIAIAYDSANNRVLIAYADVSNSNYGTAVVGTVSGTSISFGTPVVFNSAASYRNQLVFDISQSKAIVFYAAAATADSVVSVRAATISGTSVSFGGADAPMGGSNVNDFSCAYDPNNNATLFSFEDVNSSARLASIAMTLSGTAFTFGTKVQNTNYSSLSSTNLVYNAAAQKFVLSTNAGGNLYSVVVSLSGTTVTYGSGATIASGNPIYVTSVYDANLQKVFLSYSASNVSYFALGTVSGTSVSFSTPAVLNSGSNITYTSGAYNSQSQSVVLGFSDSANSSYGSGKSIVNGALTNLTATNFIGISSAAYTNGQTAVIQTVGSVDDAQTGLTAGQLYYVTPTGTLSTTAGSPSVIAGTAVSATKIIVKG